MANTSGLTSDNTSLNTTVASSDNLAADNARPTPGIIRSIGNFQAEVTVKENHHDEMTITQKPVEKGAAITDHAFANAAQLTVIVGWSAAGYSSGGGPLTLNDLYAGLLAVQKSATLISVQTGRRLYDTMLIRSIAIETDEKTANVLMITLQLQEIILVETKQTTMPVAGDRADPQATNGVTDTGTKSAKTYTGATP